MTVSHERAVLERDGPLSMIIDGEQVDAEKTFKTRNPATGEELATVVKGTEKHVNRAISVANDAFDEWKDTAPSKRAAILREIAEKIREHSDDLARLDCLDQGKPLSQSEHDVEKTARYFEYYASVIDAHRGDSIPLNSEYMDFTQREPYGVVGEIVPWNFPTNLFARGAAPALAAGNTIVLKPSQVTPLTAIVIGELITETSIPEGIVNVVPGSGSEVGKAICEHKNISKIGFTGSTSTGRTIMKSAAENVTPVSLELGGKNPYVVFPDVDFDTVADDIITANLFNAGQTCSHASRLLIHEDIHDEFIPLLVERYENLTVGRGIDDPDVGPLVSEDQLETVTKYVEIGKEEADLVTGGQTARESSDLPDGYFVEPTIFDNVDHEARISKEEIFGPVLSVIEFSNEQDAIEKANDVDYGLTSGVATKDIDRANRVARALQSGQVFVNEWYAGGVETPFGGYKQSGFGRAKGIEAFKEYSQVKNICYKVRQ